MVSARRLRTSPLGLSSRRGRRLFRVGARERSTLGRRARASRVLARVAYVRAAEALTLRRMAPRAGRTGLGLPDRARPVRASCEESDVALRVRSRGERTPAPSMGIRARQRNGRARAVVRKQRAGRGRSAASQRACSIAHGARLPRRAALDRAQRLSPARRDASRRATAARDASPLRLRIARRFHARGERHFGGSRCCRRERHEHRSERLGTLRKRSGFGARKCRAAGVESVAFRSPSRARAKRDGWAPRCSSRPSGATIYRWPI